ncbi:MAG TPA: methyltransferase [Haliangiales bacterium]|nr:methyltransferase [Haliangiales bacterium]
MAIVGNAGRAVAGFPAEAVRVHEIAGLRLFAPIDAERTEETRPPGERRLAYWARVWPGGIVLARIVAQELDLRGRRVIELGCGLGAAGIAAGRAGADVTLTDGAPATLAFAAENAAENRVAAQVLPLVWGRVPEALVERFDVVLAAEVVYERDQLAPLCGAVAALLRPGGEAWLADPDRLGGDATIEGAARAGLLAARVRTVPHPEDVPPADGGEPRPVSVYRLAKPRR